ncbi:hypothetical protein TanjilG_28334 [Lupinus angustifolius]|uniref:Uncharacterized protein n=1 Tax=Lupinus angustifolius TaxID=3871 RepID=A0A4P1RI95_LUPAN|nr:hypothetical protein TanjilG_28334 [Lupinus angustifolius]
MASTVEESTDLLNEILVRLPLKSLLRFKCVSKRWLSHISTSYFTRSHTLHHYTPFPSHIVHNYIPNDTYNSSFLTMPCSTENTDPSNPFTADFNFLNVPLQQHTYIEQSCNGILLIQGSDEPNSYYVCNPVTKQFLALDLSPPTYPNHTGQEVFLSFDPLRSPHYKLIAIRYKRDSLSSPLHGILGPNNNTYFTFEISIYSSKTACWSGFGVSIPAEENTLHEYGIYCNGAVYWCNKSEKCLYFDVEKLCFKSFPMPQRGQIEDEQVSYIGHSGGHLHIIIEQSNILLFDIFELQEDSSSWLLKFHVDLQGLFDNSLGLFEESFDILCLFCQEKEEDLVLVLVTGYQIILYNILDRTYKRLIDFNPSLSRFVRALADSGCAFEFSKNLSWDGDSSYRLASTESFDPSRLHYLDS